MRRFYSIALTLLILGAVTGTSVASAQTATIRSPTSGFQPHSGTTFYANGTVKWPNGTTQPYSIKVVFNMALRQAPL